jgi:hypothetical protein
MKFVAKTTDEQEAERKTSTATTSEYDEGDDHEFTEDFAEALDDIDLNELLANHLLIHQNMAADDDTASTSSKGKRPYRVAHKVSGLGANRKLFLNRGNLNLRCRGERQI